VLNQHKLSPTPGVVEPLLRGRFGVPYLWSAECDSTQDVLRDPTLPEGAVAATDHQTAGRGREARRWEDEPGSALLFSLLLRPATGAPVAQLSLVCALAVAETVEDESGRQAGVKWPNDVLVEGRKVAGILLEAREGAVICGIGLNVDQDEAALPADVRTQATSLRLHTGRAHDRPTLLAALLRRLEARYDTWVAAGLAPLLPELERRNVLRARRIPAEGADGVAGAIAPDGRLVLLRDDGTSILVGSGEVSRAPGRAGSRTAL
jgi:BirA family biotin operon repressor/biotin-[acetyl-CoA-carboxylase] ligase